MKFATESHPYININLEMKSSLFNRLFFMWTSEVNIIVFDLF